MAVTDRNSTGIANLVASPRVVNKPSLGGGNQVIRPGLIASAADDSANSVGRFCRVPSNASNIRILVTCAIASSAGAIDIGLYDIASRNSGAVVDADFFASAQSLSSAALNYTDLTHESGVYTITKSSTMLWEALGLTSDPCVDYDVAYTITTTFNGGPTAIKMHAEFIV